MGLIGSSLALLYCGGHGVYLSPLSFIQDPCLWLLLITRYRGTHLQSPNFAFSLLLRHLPYCPYRTQIDLRSVRHWFNAAEPIQAEIMKQFIEIASTEFGLNRSALVGGYGLAESCVYVSDEGQQILRIRREVFERDQTVEVVSEEDCAKQGKRVRREDDEK